MPSFTSRRSLPLAVALGTMLVAGACARTPEGTEGVSSPGRTTDAISPTAPTGGSGPRLETPSVEPVVVPEILDFEAPLVGGGTLRGAELAGAPVAAWFWAPW